jgi:hypothetical protein
MTFDDQKNLIARSKRPQKVDVNSLRRIYCGSPGGIATEFWRRGIVTSTLPKVGDLISQN